MKLYYARMAPNPDRVRFFLQEKGQWDAFPKTEISIMKNEHRDPAYRALSPMAHVPVLELEDGTGLSESRAICTYLEGLFPEPNLMGVDALERAKIEMWDRRVELTYFMQIAGWFRNSHPAMAELEKPQSAEWAGISEGRARKVATFFDRRLSESAYVAGDRFTIADITLHVALGFGKLVKFKPWEAEHPHLAAWRERVSARAGLKM
jgi:glutathione S-transferase